jgi:hypothetical protein
MDRRRRTRVRALGMIVLGMSSCRSATEPRVLRLEFDSAVVRSSLPSVRATSDGHTIRLAGGYVDATCVSAGARAVQRGAVVRIDVAARRVAAVCVDVRFGHRYEAVVHGLTPGNYLVEVYHWPSDRRDGELALRQQVELR